MNWLSELREVSVLFINMNPGLSLNATGHYKCCRIPLRLCMIHSLSTMVSFRLL